MPKTNAHILGLLAILLLMGCAQVRSISGGEKDTDAPVLLETLPASGSLHFSDNSFTLYFNEYIQLRDLQKELLVSPPLQKAPRVKVKQRSVEVAWDDTLRQETTYIFQFGKSIADVNESNALRDLTFVFSTGNQLDSLVCAGRVIDAFTDKPVNDGKVLLFDSLENAFNAEARPAYFARTNERGEFRLNHLRYGNYVMCALSDENGNNHFDIGESIAWQENVAPSFKGDTTEWLLFMSVPRDTLLRSFNYMTDSSGVLKFHIDPWTPITQVKSLSGDSITQWVVNDTLFATTSALCDNRLEVAVSCGEKTIDTLSISQQPDEIPTLKATALFNPKMTATESVYIRTSRPIQHLEKSQLTCLMDTVDVPVTSLVVNPTQCEIRFDKQPGKTYRISALPGWLTDDCGEANDTLSLNLSTYNLKELGSLRFMFNSEINSNPHTFQLLDKSKKTVFKLDSVRSSELLLEELIPGDYTAIIGDDHNANGYFDPVNIRSFSPSERNHVYVGNIQVRANWEVVVDWTELSE
jgi:hypothetical protein